MLRSLCKSKIINMYITGKDLQYDGSIGIDKEIMDAADITPGEQVHVLNANNGERFTTYVIEEKIGTRRVVLYGPAARKGEVGDNLVVLSYCLVENKECRNFNMCVVALGKNNQYKGK